MILNYLLMFTAFTGSAFVILNIIGANVYDIQQVNKRRQLLLHPNSKRHRRRPLVSVIVPTYNNDSVIERCLESILKSNYRNIEIIVADNASKDGTKNTVRSIKAKYPKKNIKLYAKHKNEDGNISVANAYRYKAQGEIIILLENALCLVEKETVKKIALQFNIEDNLDILSVNYKTIPEYMTAGIFQEFSLLLRNRAKKTGSVFSVDYFSDSIGAVAYSSKFFAKLVKSGPKLTFLPAQLPGDKIIRSQYAGDVAVFIESQTFFGLAKQYYSSQLYRLRIVVAGRSVILPDNPHYSIYLSWLYLLLAGVFGLLALAVPVLLTYFVYLAINLHEPALLLVSWAAMGIYLLFAIWEDEQLGLGAKARYIALIPITFGWFYLMSFVKYAVLLTSYRARRML